MVCCGVAKSNEPNALTTKQQIKDHEQSKLEQKNHHPPGDGNGTGSHPLSRRTAASDRAPAQE
jgi:hypothetical protein